MADRVVFDTNIHLAAVLWRGAAYKCWLAARVGLVEVVYSGDRHLLDLGEYQGIRIVTPAAFLGWLAENS